MEPEEPRFLSQNEIIFIADSLIIFSGLFLIKAGSELGSSFATAIGVLALYGGILLIGSVLFILVMNRVFKENKTSVTNSIEKLTNTAVWRLFKVLYIIGLCIATFALVNSALSYTCSGIGCNEGLEVGRALGSVAALITLLIGVYFIIRRLIVYILYGV